MGEKMTGNFAYMASLFTPLVIFYMLQIYDMGPTAFTSPPKEGVLRIFSPLKIRQLRPGFNPRTWVLKASKLPPRPPKPNYILYISLNFFFTSKHLKSS